MTAASDYIQQIQVRHELFGIKKQRQQVERVNMLIMIILPNQPNHNL